MGLKSTRKILSIVFAVIISFSLAACVSCVVETFTVSSRGFYEKHFSTQALADECDKQLTKKYTVLSKKSNIPLEVFESVKKQYSTALSLKQAASYLFDENDSTLNSDARLKYFYSICTEYLDANELNYSKEDVYNTCVEASQIYSDTVGIHNLDYIKNDVDARNRDNTRKVSAFILSVALCVVFTLFMYKKRLQGMIYICSGIMGGGISVVVSSLLKLIFKVGTAYDVQPECYSAVFSHMAKSYLLYEAIGGLALLLVGIVILFVVQRLISRDEFRKNTRFYKVVEKL